MRIIFSRKGFDTGSGGKPSPIVDGRPISLPIPATRNSRTTYAILALATSSIGSRRAASDLAISATQTRGLRMGSVHSGSRVRHKAT